MNSYKPNTMKVKVFDFDQDQVNKWVDTVDAEVVGISHALKDGVRSCLVVTYKEPNTLSK